VAQSKVNVVPNAIEVRKEPSRSRELELIRRLGWHSNFLVTSVGRLEEVKGHTYLLSAMKLVLQQCPDARCLIVGDGRLRQQLEVQVVELGLTGYVHLSGFSDDVPQILNATDVMCMPSLSEGLPFAVLEACAHQVPLLVSGVGGMAKLLTHGQTAYVTPPADSDSLARGIEWYFTHPGEATRIARIAHELVLERFSVDAMLACTLEAYRGAHASAPIPPSESLRG
jgi:glycosyltransferase involved in cell wall biosynthesis